MSATKRDQPPERKKRIEELRPVILELIDEHGGSNKQIAEALNQKNVPNLAGQTWKDSDVSNFKMRYLKEEKAADKEATSTARTATTAEQAQLDIAQVEADLAEAKSPPVADTTTSIPATSDAMLAPDLVDLLSAAHISGELIDLLTWWRTTKGEMERPMPIKRPKLAGPEGRVNTGLLIDKALKDRALEAAKKDPATTGGSLSLLIELLLWRFLGEPAEFVVKED